MTKEELISELRGLVTQWRNFVSIGNMPSYAEGKEAGKQSCADDLDELIENATKENKAPEPFTEKVSERFQAK